MNFIDIDSVFMRMKIEMRVEYKDGKEHEEFTLTRTIEDDGTVRDYHSGYIDDIEPQIIYKTKSDIIRKYRDVMDEVQDEFHDNYMEKIRVYFTESNATAMCYTDTKIKDNEILNFNITFSNITPELNNEINKYF